MKQKRYNEKHPKTLKRLIAFVFSVMLFVSAIAQEKTVTGVVTDNTGTTLPGVNVVIKGTTTGTITDLNGKYSIKVPGSETILVFSYVGYATQEITVGDQTNINVTMSEEAKELDQVVVIGYGVMKKSDLSGSVASVSGSSFQGIAVTNLNQALQGRAAGVNVISNTGMPGGSVTIQIRGMSSVNGGTPLVVIDGIPGGDINSLNPADIESVEVLKDAASQAIYGSNGGNGVIIVTTKKGKSGKLQTTFNSSYGWQNVAHKVEMMGLEDYNRTMAELLKKEADLSINQFGYFRNIDTLRYYNYNDIIFKDDVPVQNYDFSASGGNEKSNFYISGSYMDQEGIIKKSNYEKLNFRVKSEHQLTDKIKFDENVSFLNSVTEGMEEWMYTNVYFTPIYVGMVMPPFMPPYNEDGTWTAPPGNNPFGIIDNRNYKSKLAQFSGNTGFTINLVKGLTYSPRVNGYMGINDVWNFTPKYFVKANQSNEKNNLRQGLQRQFGWVLQNVLNYEFNLLEIHKFNVMVGQEAKRNWGYDLNGMRQSFKSTLPNMLYMSKSLDDTTNAQAIEGGGYESRMSSYFGRFSYDLKSIFLLQVNVRRDGHSDFGPNNRFGTFKSISGALKFTEFDMFKSIEALSFGKIRISYGETGQYARSNWPYFAKILTPTTYAYSFDNSTAIQGAGPVQLPNPDIHWETVKSTTIGLELGLFRDKLMFTVEWFNKINDGMLNLQDVTTMAGTFQTQSSSEGGSAKPEVNFGNVRNRGLEFAVSYKQNFGDFRTMFDLNLTYINNEITKLATDSVVQGGVHNELSGVTILKVGKPISTFWGYRVESIIKPTDPKVINPKNNKEIYFQVNSKGDTILLPSAKAGDVRWKDLNNDGRIDNGDRDYLGNPNPPFIFSFSINLSYKNIDFSALFNGVYGNKIFNGSGRYFYDWNTVASNRSAKFANRYREPFTDKNGNLILYENGTPIDEGNTVNYTMPRMDANNYGRSSDIYIEDGSYLRLSNLQIGYTLPKNVTNLVNFFRVEKFRVYASVTNLFTITNYTGFDPEVARYDFGNPAILGIDIGGYPRTRVFTIGANIIF